MAVDFDTKLEELADELMELMPKGKTTPEAEENLQDLMFFLATWAAQCVWRLQVVGYDPDEGAARIVERVLGELREQNKEVEQWDREEKRKSFQVVKLSQ